MTTDGANVAPNPAVLGLTSYSASLFFMGVQSTHIAAPNMGCFTSVSFI